jgi:hypothetical protein
MRFPGEKMRKIGAVSQKIFRFPAAGKKNLSAGLFFFSIFFFFFKFFFFFFFFFFLKNLINKKKKPYKKAQKTPKKRQKNAKNTSKIREISLKNAEFSAPKAKKAPTGKKTSEIDAFSAGKRRKTPKKCVFGPFSVQFWPFSSNFWRFSGVFRPKLPFFAPFSAVFSSFSRENRPKKREFSTVGGEKTSGAAPFFRAVFAKISGKTLRFNEKIAHFWRENWNFQRFFFDFWAPISFIFLSEFEQKKKKNSKKNHKKNTHFSSKIAVFERFFDGNTRKNARKAHFQKLICEYEIQKNEWKNLKSNQTARIVFIAIL